MLHCHEIILAIILCLLSSASCLDDETKDENGECKKCNKWTSIIDDEGRCVKCGDNERVSETKDGRRVCTSKPVIHSIYNQSK